jgi:hypothetical protein
LGPRHGNFARDEGATRIVGAGAQMIGVVVALDRRARHDRGYRR